MGGQRKAGGNVADALFRIASVSKPITSATIFTLIEAGRIKLSDRIFGPGAILGTDYGRPPYHPHVDEITVENLLTHTGGGWNNQHADPMFMNVGMNHAQGLGSRIVLALGCNIAHSDS